jgi:hypothetical protein
MQQVEGSAQGKDYAIFFKTMLVEVLLPGLFAVSNESIGTWLAGGSVYSLREFQLLRDATYLAGIVALTVGFVMLVLYYMASSIGD